MMREGLRNLGVSFDQDESSVHRFKISLETIIEYNRRLRTVSAGSEGLLCFSHTDLMKERFPTSVGC